MLFKKSKALVILSALVFTFGLTSFTVSNVYSWQIEDPETSDPCYHCGSYSACLTGGQPYGVYNSDCTIQPSEYGTPEYCIFWGVGNGDDELVDCP